MSNNPFTQLEALVQDAEYTVKSSRRLESKRLPTRIQSYSTTRAI